MQPKPECNRNSPCKSQPQTNRSRPIAIALVNVSSFSLQCFTASYIYKYINTNTNKHCRDHHITERRPTFIYYTIVSLFFFIFPISINLFVSRFFFFFSVLFTLLTLFIQKKIIFNIYKYLYILYY